MLRKGVGEDYTTFFARAIWSSGSKGWPIREFSKGESQGVSNQGGIEM